MSDAYLQRARHIVTEDAFARLLGVKLLHLAENEVKVELPYREDLGQTRVHGGAISALVDIAATACFWAHPALNDKSRGATVGFTVNFLSLAVATDLTAVAAVRRRGGTLCTGDVSIRTPDGNEVATAIVTYKLNP